MRRIVDGSSGSIWRAVGAAKDLNLDTIPAHLTVGGVNVDPHGVAGAFALHFSEKNQIRCSSGSC